MSRVFKNISSQKVGLPPGTPVHVGKAKTAPVRISIIDYDETTFLEKDAASVEDCFSYIDSNTITWINIDGVHEFDIIDKIGKCYRIHPLVLEDIMNTGQRPKMEVADDYVYLVLRMLSYDYQNDEILSEQISILFGSNFIISFQEQEGDVFDSVRTRIRNKRGRIRRMGADYLAYALMDTVVDHYFIVLEKLGETIENLEEELMQDPGKDTVVTIHALKNEMIYLRRIIWPLREVVSALEREESELIHDSTTIFLRDLYDHTIQIIDAIEESRDMLAGMLDVYLSSLSNKMNEVMKTLTIIATLFIPLTFVAGIYGMNFKYMPELEWRYGYLFFWMVILIVSIIMVIFFKRKRWF